MIRSIVSSGWLSVRCESHRADTCDPFILPIIWYSAVMTVSQPVHQCPVEGIPGFSCYEQYC